MSLWLAGWGGVRGQFQGTIIWTHTQVRGQRSSEGDSFSLWATDINTIDTVIRVSERVGYSVLCWTKTHRQGGLWSIINKVSWSEEKQFRWTTRKNKNNSKRNLVKQKSLTWRCQGSKVSREETTVDVSYIYTPAYTLKMGINSNFSIWDKQDIIES